MKDIGNQIVYKDGRVWSKHYERFVKPCKLKNGYLQIGLNRKKMYLHRLIAQTFISNPHNLPEIDHIDNNKENCAVENLQWCTRRDNMQKAWKEGRIPRLTPEQRNNCKLTTKEVYKIKYELSHLNNAQISRIFKNASEQTIGKIRKGLSWKEI